MSVETDAIALAIRFFESDGYTVQDVSRARGHNGYDLLITRDGSATKVEVKGCTRPWQIPDPYETEFDPNRRLVADLLCVVYLMDPEQPSLCLIPRDAIPADMVKPKMGYRISGRFKKQEVLEQFWRPLHLTDDSRGQSDA